MCVYDWIRLHRSERIIRRHSKKKSQILSETEDNDNLSDVDDHLREVRKAEKNKAVHIPDNYFRPLESHPLYPTHVYHCVQDRSDNFRGGSLPRNDKSEIDTYSRCMLTLFKPWRSGSDLQSDSQTWEKAFSSWNFSDRQHEIMRNIQMKHECRDARDDFSLQKKKDLKKTNRFFHLSKTSQSRMTLN